MAKHANKRTRSTHTARIAGKNWKPSKKIGETPVPRGRMELKMKLLNGFGVDEGLATRWLTAIALDDLGTSIMCGELLRHSGMSPLTLRWDCKVIKHAMLPRAGVVDVYMLAHLCASKRVLPWLIAWGINDEAEEVCDALNSLSKSFGDGLGDSTEVSFAREVIEALFVPDTTERAREVLYGLSLNPNLGPHVERFVREACLSLLAKEEHLLLREATDRRESLPRSSAQRPGL